VTLVLYFVVLRCVYSTPSKIATLRVSHVTSYTSTDYSLGGRYARFLRFMRLIKVFRLREHTAVVNSGT
jgi:hypothetical protein